jgi:hypothetical protein
MLRSMLLNAFGWWKVSQIMYIASLIAFGLGGRNLQRGIREHGREPVSSALLVSQGPPAQRRRVVSCSICDSFSGLRTAYSPVMRPSSMRAAMTVSIWPLSRTISAG